MQVRNDMNSLMIEGRIAGNTKLSLQEGMPMLEFEIQTEGRYFANGERRYSVRLTVRCYDEISRLVENLKEGTKVSVYGKIVDMDGMIVVVSSDLKYRNKNK